MWGSCLIPDCAACEKEAFRSAQTIREFCRDLVESIGMVAHEEPLLEHFATHLPAAGAVTGRFYDASGGDYLDVCSREDFDPKVAIEVVERRFRPRSTRRTVPRRDVSLRAGEAVVFDNAGLKRRTGKPVTWGRVLLTPPGLSGRIRVRCMTGADLPGVSRSCGAWSAEAHPKAFVWLRGVRDACWAVTCAPGSGREDALSVRVRRATRGSQ